jgi:S1-C subfamily serine protease
MLGFQKVNHPYRDHSIWIPFGLGLTVARNEFGLHYTDRQNRLMIDFTTVKDLSIALNFDTLVKLVTQNSLIHYKVLKGNWFVISSTSTDGIDSYMRYHQDGANVTGFSLYWNNAHGDVHGDRIAVVMSASLWSEMTGAAFIEPQSLITRPNSVPAPAQSQAAGASPNNTEPPPADDKVSTGTGFFVSRDGAFITNAHVIEGCTAERLMRELLPGMRSMILLCLSCQTIQLK